MHLIRYHAADMDLALSSEVQRQNQNYLSINTCTLAKVCHIVKIHV